MPSVLKENQTLNKRYELFVTFFEQQDIPENVNLWVNEADQFGYVFLEATVSAKIIELNIVVDLLHRPVNLWDFRTATDIKMCVESLAGEIRQKYGQMFTDPRDLRQ